MFFSNISPLLKTKKLLIVIISLFLFLILITILLLNKSSSSPSSISQDLPVPTSIKIPKINNALPDIKSSSIVRLSSKKIYSLNFFNNTLYYVSSENGATFYRNSTDGTKEERIAEFNATSPEENHVIWAHDASSVILKSITTDPESSSQTIKSSWFYNLETKASQELSDIMLSASLSPNGRQIAYVQPEDVNGVYQGVLYILNIDGSGKKRIGPFPNSQNYVKFLNSRIIASYLVPNPFVKNIPFFITDIEQGTFTQITTGGNVYGISISPTREYILSERADTSQNPYIPSLVLINPQTKRVIDLKLKAYLANSAWSKKTNLVYSIDSSMLTITDPISLNSKTVSLPINNMRIDPYSLLVVNNDIFFTSEQILYKVALK